MIMATFNLPVDMKGCRSANRKTIELVLTLALANRVITEKENNSCIQTIK